MSNIILYNVFIKYFSEENIKTENKNVIYSGLKFRREIKIMSGLPHIVIHPKNGNGMLGGLVEFGKQKFRYNMEINFDGQLN